VNYFSGFCLSEEQTLFPELIVEGETTVAGFSYGAQQALEYAVNSKTRIDRLILLSPAFFHDQTSEFKESQLHYFKQHHASYIKQFLKNVVYPSRMDLASYFKLGKEEELESLLHYKWEEEKFQMLQQRGVAIEVFLGGKDKIVNTQKAMAFFEPLATCYLIKEVGHLLQQ
jgi:pimeloyl-ACP methyl ester carboxylesterase